MNPPAPTQQPLRVPDAGRAHYARNFIRLAVCELRFPTLFELEGEHPPVAFARALRKEYPTHELLANVALNAGGLAHANAHAFRSRKGRWSVTLRAAAVSLETSLYESFDEFVTRLAFVVKAAESTIDSDFFTRVGLRYINALPCAPEVAGGWVNEALVGPLVVGTYGTVGEYWQRVQGPTRVGGYTFQHGVPIQAGEQAREYMLDFDFFKEDVAVVDALSVVKELHELEHAMFDWSLGPKAKEHLGPSTR
jgi:uncharacterized protein (TIGR04255 family)